MASFSRTTILTYARALRDLQDYHHALADALTSEEILDFLAHRQTQVGNSTLNQICCALKYFYGRVIASPERVVDIPTPRKPGQLGELLTADELRRLVAAAANLRHRVVIELLIGLGLRGGEIGRLRLGDFDRHNRSVTIRGAKGGHIRVLPYGERLRTTLRVYFLNYRPDDYLIPAGHRGQKPGIAVRGVQYILRQTRQRARLRKPFSPHTLRHCFAVHYLNNGGSLVRLQQLLGHKYLTTTLRYLSYASIPLRDTPSPLDFLYVSPAD